MAIYQYLYSSFLYGPSTLIPTYFDWSSLIIVSLALKAPKWSLATFSSKILGKIYTSFLYFWVFSFYHNSICARVWLVNEADITNDGWPVAQPKFNNLPSANKIIEWLSSKVNLSTWGLMLILLIPGHFFNPSYSI